MLRLLTTTLLGLTLVSSGAMLAANGEAEEFVQRRAQILREIGAGVLLVRNSADRGEVAFQGNRDFLYLTGINETEGVLLMAPRGARVRGSGSDYFGSPLHREILFLAEIGERERRWNGPKIGPGREAAEISGVEAVFPLRLLDRVLADTFSTANILHFSAASSPRLDGPLNGNLRFLENLRKRFFWLEVRDAGRLIHSLRMVKSPAEVAKIQKAVDLAGEGIWEVLKQAAPGILESEVEGILGKMFLSRGARFSFDPIVASGGNSTILHYRANRDRLQDGELVVLDIGASVDHYASDITRTFPVSGTFSPRQAEIYRLVLKAQRAGIGAVRPGVTLSEIHQVAFQIIQEAGYGEFVVHGTSHHLGLDVHDVGNIHIPLSAGAVITVEPGIYLPEENLGVRIEDDILVTESGNRVLSDAIPRELEAIESAMSR
ncbi:MAG: Xaa-Pro peptidase family protein [Acidobacteria bacterium]|nr:Xaa-Pro peptidase family protein [Acidobacteriota bacterium]